MKSVRQEMECKQKMSINYKKTALDDINIFIDVVKDRVCDWINYHHLQPDKDLVDIRKIEFDKKIYGVAVATYDSKLFCRQYYFVVSFDLYQKGVYLDVLVNSIERSAWITNKWDGFTYLAFDKKGYSYEVSKEDYELLNQAKENSKK